MGYNIFIMFVLHNISQIIDYIVELPHKKLLNYIAQLQPNSHQKSFFFLFIFFDSFYIYKIYKSLQPPQSF